jgi:hypothetical protein
VVANSGTVVVRELAVALVTTAATPLKSTLFAVELVENPVPLMIIDVPGIPCSGEKPEMVREGESSSFLQPFNETKKTDTKATKRNVKKVLIVFMLNIFFHKINNSI